MKVLGENTVLTTVWVHAGENYCIESGIGVNGQE